MVPIDSDEVGRALCLQVARRLGHDLGRRPARDVTPVGVVFEVALLCRKRGEHGPQIQGLDTVPGEHLQ